MKKQTLILMVMVIFSSLLLLIASQKQRLSITNTPNLNTNNLLNIIDKHYCQIDDDCGGISCCGCLKKTKICNMEDFPWGCKATRDICRCINNKCQKTPPKEVFIGLTRLSHKQGQKIKIEIANHLDETIYWREIQCGASFWQLEKKVGTQWEEVKSLDATTCRWEAPSNLKELRSFKAIQATWPMYKYSYAEYFSPEQKQKNFPQLNIGEFIEPGKYRFVFPYYLGCTKLNHPIECQELTRTYSYEFSVID